MFLRKTIDYFKKHPKLLLSILILTTAFIAYHQYIIGKNVFLFNDIGVDVSSINYDNPSNIVYSWKLEGFYDEWTSLTNDNRIRYTCLLYTSFPVRKWTIC